MLNHVYIWSTLWQKLINDIFQKMSFFIDFKLFAKTNFPEKKIVLIFNQFSVKNSLICCTWQQGQIKILNFKRDLLETAKSDLSTFAKTCFSYL